MVKRKATAQKKKVGRPSVYTDKIAAIICERLSDGESLRSICCDASMPNKKTVFRWLMSDVHADFATKYARAREIQADSLVDDMTDIADDGSNDWMEKRNADGENIGWQENGEALRRSALRISTRQWIAEKLRPKKYGTKIDVDQKTTHEAGDSVFALMQAIDGRTRTK